MARAYPIARRNELARARGFRNYYDQRRQFEYARRSGETGHELGRTSYVERFGIPNARNPEDSRRVRLFYRAFHDDPNDYSIDGPKAQWFVEIERIMNYDEWRERYPTGTR